VTLSKQTQFELAEIAQQIQSLKKKQALILANAELNIAPTQARVTKVKNIVVVGGGGQLGGLFVKLFKQQNYQVNIVESGDWGTEQTNRAFKNADLVLIAVPIDLTLNVIENLDKLPSNCILADITSIKQKPLLKMLEVHNGPVVGLHPMFGPGSVDFEKQTIVICHGRYEDSYSWLIEQLRSWRAKLHFTSAKKHDDTMAIVQVLRHFSTIAYGAHLANEDVSLQEVMAMSSPIYRLELAMVGRLFAQAPELYTEIIFSNKENTKMMQRFITQFESLLALLKDNDKSAFKQTFLDVRSWFGEHAEKFLNDSNQMLNLNQNN
jgi:chorismate mutase/prephenate dehydrogenase